MLEKYTETCGLPSCFSAYQTSAYRSGNIVLCNYLNENNINEEKGYLYQVLLIKGEIMGPAERRYSQREQEKLPASKD